MPAVTRSLGRRDQRHAHAARRTERERERERECECECDRSCALSRASVCVGDRRAASAALRDESRRCAGRRQRCGTGFHDDAIRVIAANGSNRACTLGEGDRHLGAHAESSGRADEVARALGIAVDKVRVHVTFLGGGFGRKSKADFCSEAALLSKRLGAPVRVQFTREDDVRHDYVNTVSTNRLTAGLDASGRVIAWRHRTAFPSIGSLFGEAPRPALDDLQQGVLGGGRIVRIGEVPRRVHIEIVESDAAPGGVGEPGVPPIAPAIGNAVFALTGRRVRELPLSKTIAVA